MWTYSNQTAPPSGRRGSNLPAALCSWLGGLILLAVILVCLPVPLAHLAGYEMYNVISGSMEPAIPVGSAVYVRPTPPAELAAGEVAAFHSQGAVVIHRVVENDPLTGCLVTQGDANAQPDISPVRYSQVIGRVVRHTPALGRLLSLSTGGGGRVYLICFALCGALFSLVGFLLRARDKRALPPPSQEEAARLYQALLHRQPSAAAPARPRRGRARRLLTALLGLVFVGSLAAVLVIQRGYQAERAFYQDMARQYTAPAADSQAPAELDGPVPPITVDFNALRAVNGDIAGWLYCEGTGIDYPVLHCSDNDTYLHHNYQREPNSAGSIFVEAQNQGDFSDANTIIYGHNMRDGSMFAPLKQWQDESFAKEHPVLWLLTPEQNYQILPFSAYTTSAYSSTYTIFTGPAPELDEYLQRAVEQSVIAREIELSGEARYVLLTTCVYAGSNPARYVVHGLLQPV